MSKECKRTFVMNKNRQQKFIAIDPSGLKAQPIPVSWKIGISRRDD